MIETTTENGIEQPTVRALSPKVRQILEQRLSDSVSDRQKLFDCELCGDIGSIFRPASETRLAGFGDCDCRIEKLRAKKLAVIPAQYRPHADLSAIEPDNNRHKKQKAILAELRRNPGGNYLLAGDFGTGKTLFFWALYREAIKSGRKTYANTLRALLDSYTRAFRTKDTLSERVEPDISSEQLRQNRSPVSLFLDDIDKARPSEYVAEQLFELVDAAHSFNHQVVITTNLRVADLVRHFERADDRFGRAIVRRLVDGAQVLEMF